MKIPAKTAQRSHKFKRLKLFVAIASALFLCLSAATTYAGELRIIKEVTASGWVTPSGSVIELDDVAILDFPHKAIKNGRILIRARATVLEDIETQERTVLFDFDPDDTVFENPVTVYVNEDYLTQNPQEMEKVYYWDPEEGMWIFFSEAGQAEGDDASYLWFQTSHFSSYAFGRVPPSTP